MVEAYLHSIDTALAEAYAEHLDPIIGEIVYKRCSGCLYDHPSQTKHDICVMMTEEERVGLCLEEAIQLVDLDKVMVTFRAHNELPHLAHQIEQIAWQRTTNHRWLDLVEAKIVQLREDS